MIFTAIILSLLAGAPTFGATLHATPVNYLSRVRGLVPGDVLELSPGRYEDGLRLHDIHGTPGKPITIRGPAIGEPALLVGRPGRNTISLAAASHIEIRDLVLDGRGLEVAGVRAERRDTLVHHITIENLTIVGHGPEQQTVGISTAAPAAYWIIRNNIIVGAGTGLYLGGSDGAAPFVAGVIEGNVIVGTTGYNLQIKHQNPRPLLPGMPDGALRTTLRGNVFAKTATSSTGSMARPNLLLGHFPLRGPGQDDEYRVEQNVFYGNPTEALMQAEGNVVVEGNLLMNPFGDGLVIQPHKDVPRRVAVLGNFAAVSGSGIHVVGVDPGHPQVVSRNEIVPYASFTAHTTHEAGDVLKSPLARWLGEREAAEARRTALLRALRVACAPLSLERAGVPPIGIIPGDAPVCMDSLLGQTRRRGK